MKKRVKSKIVTWLIILIIVVGSIIYLNSNGTEAKTSKEITKCIGENAILYTQVGCSHCETQKEIFGEYIEYLTEIDCTKTPKECSGISGTPTWIINGEEHLGVQSIEELRELTGC